MTTHPTHWIDYIAENKRAIRRPGEDLKTFVDRQLAANAYLINLVQVRTESLLAHRRQHTEALDGNRADKSLPIVSSDNVVAIGAIREAAIRRKMQADEQRLLTSQVQVDGEGMDNFSHRLDQVNEDLIALARRRCEDMMHHRALRDLARALPTSPEDSSQDPITP